MTDETRTDEPEQPPAEQGATAIEQTAVPPAEGEGDEGAAPERSKLVQTVEIKDIGPCKKHIKVQVDRASIDERLDAKFKELMPEANVHGFRPGKAPKALVRRYYRKDVGNQVKAELLLESLEQLAEEHDIAPLTAPDLDPFKVELPEAGPLVYEFDVEVRPQFDLPNYKGLKLRRIVHTFTPEEIEQEERRLLTPYGQIVPKPEGDAQLYDIIIADVTTRDGDRVLSDIKESQFRVNKQLAFKDGIAKQFLEQVKGANPGDTRVVDITLSSLVADPALQGKTVQATFQIKEVKAVKMPELTHEFLHTFHVHTPEQLRELVHVVLQRRLEYQQRQSIRQQVLDHIAAASTWELPNDLLLRQARRALQRRVMEMKADGISEDEIDSRMRLLQQDVIKSTELALKEHFVLQKIAEVEKIDVNDEDLEDEIDRMAEQTDESPRRVRARLEKEDMLEALAIEMIERKALDLILDTAEYTDVPLGTENEEPAMTTSEQQAVPGEMKDVNAPPAEETPGNPA
jgi:trigger factor